MNGIMWKLIVLAVVGGICVGQPSVLLVSASELAPVDDRAEVVHLDGLRATSLVFDAAYAASPIGSPSQAGLLTGRHPMSLVIPDEIEHLEVTHLRRGTPTIASMLAQRGYWTSVFGAWRVTGMFGEIDRQPDPEHLGFDHWLCTLGDPRPDTRATDGLVRNGDPLDPIEEQLSDHLAREAAAWIQEQRRAHDEPWFCYVSLEGTASTPSPARLAAVRERHESLDPDEVSRIAALESFDEALGMLLQASGEGAVVIVTALHGPEAPVEGRRGAAGTLFEGGLRVPCLVRHPSIEAGHQESPVWGLDVLPTIAAMTGCDSPPDVEGVSMLDVPPERVMLWHFHRASSDARIGVRRGPWVLLGQIRKGPSGPWDDGLESHLRRAPIMRESLYNIVEDPSQDHDVRGDHPDVMYEMSRLLRDRFDTWRSSFEPW